MVWYFLMLQKISLILNLCCLWTNVDSLWYCAFRSRPQLQDLAGDEPDHEGGSAEEKQDDDSTASAAVATTDAATADGAATEDNTAVEDGAAAVDDGAATEDGAAAEDGSAASGTADTDDATTAQQAPPIPPRRQASVQDVKDFFVDAGNKIEGAFESLKKHKMNALAVGRVPPTPDDAFAVSKCIYYWLRRGNSVSYSVFIFFPSCVLDGGSLVLCVEGRGQRSRFKSKGLARTHGNFHFSHLHDHERICWRLDHRRCVLTASEGVLMWRR